MMLGKLVFDLGGFLFYDNSQIIFPNICFDLCSRFIGNPCSGNIELVVLPEPVCVVESYVEKDDCIVRVGILLASLDAMPYKDYLKKVTEGVTKVSAERHLSLDIFGTVPKGTLFFQNTRVIHEESQKSLKMGFV
jgi:hypothetical protein